MLENHWLFKLCKLSIPLAPDAPGKLHVFGHYGHALGMDGAQVGVLEDADQVCLGCFLECQDCCRLKPQIVATILRDLFYQPLEREFSYQKVGRFLELSDLSQGDRARSKPRLSPQLDNLLLLLRRHLSAEQHRLLARVDNHVSSNLLRYVFCSWHSCLFFKLNF